MIEHAVEQGVALKGGSALLNKIALYLRGRAAYSEAEPLFRRALVIRETQFGKNHPFTNTVRNELDDLLLDMKSRDGQ